MNEQNVLEWIKKQQPVLDKIIYEAAYNFFEQNKSKDNFPFDLEECQSESFNLIGNKDLCYDRYCTAFIYSLWYHARRLNTFLRFFAKAIMNSNDTTIEIFDLGAGTGSVQFSVALAYLAMEHIGIKPPKIRIINIDTSPFMLAYNKDFLWESFLKYYPKLNKNPNFLIEYSVNSWNVTTQKKVQNPWLTASYLFDISDNKDIIASEFVQMITYYKPVTVLLLTSNQKEKLEMLNSVLQKIKANNYFIENITDSSLLFSGELGHVNTFRKFLNQHYQGRGLGSLSGWNDSSFIGTILRTKEQSFNLETNAKVDKIDLFNPKIKVRKDIRLSNTQKKASLFLGRPSIIVGPAGSGKSVVISEKIKYIVETNNYSPNLRILVTTFNKGLIKKLGDWLNTLLKADNFTKTMISEDASQFKFTNSSEPNITLLHFDLLPTRLAGIKHDGLVFDEKHLSIIEKCIEQVKKDKNITDVRFDNILNAEFIYEEYHRVFYGLNIKTKEGYLSVKRVGMWQGLNKERREIVFDCINKYMTFLHKSNISSFTNRRRHFLNKLEKGELNIKYDYIFVDEFQDCTKSDFAIFFNLIKDVNNITFGGDLAQAIHIGKSADIPREENMKRRERFLLEGSYRLPQRISESIKQLSKTIVTRWGSNEGAKEIAPVKNSPPGARPIVVFASDLSTIAKKIKQIFDTYKVYDLTKITILEKDLELWRELQKIDVLAETDTILRLKGLEKDCILWSTRKSIDDDKEVYEFVYTILTRTSSILIIALSDSTKESYKKVINLLDIDKLIFWDKETKQKYNSFCENVKVEMIEFNNENE